MFHSRAYASAEEMLLEATASKRVRFDALRGLIKARLIFAVESNPQLSLLSIRNPFYENRDGDKQYKYEQDDDRKSK